MLKILGAVATLLYASSLKNLPNSKLSYLLIFERLLAPPVMGCIDSAEGIKTEKV